MTGSTTAKLLTGVIGHPVGHSLSPVIHNHWIREYGFPAIYQGVDIAPEDLLTSVGRMVENGYIGFNVTLPHKQAIMELCDTIEETARRIGAVNTVSISESGKLKGMNTDSYGFVENILQADITTNFKEGKALVLGAGGAARAVVHGLMQLGIHDILIANRTRQKIDDIATVFPVKAVAWEERAAAAEDAIILVNTTSLGMTGQPNLEMDLQHLPVEAVVCDIVYKPLDTTLLQNAKKRGNAVVTGIGMLLQQARPAFREWFGVMPDVDADLRQKILQSLSGESKESANG